MNRKRMSAGLLIVFVLGSAAYLTLLSFGFFATAAELPAVPPGHREIIFLAPATSGDAWDRLVAAVDALQQEAQQSGKPRLNVIKRRAFPPLTADVPEVTIWPDGSEHAQLWIRWCKLSAEARTEDWIEKLVRRSSPPLAICPGCQIQRGEG